MNIFNIVDKRIKYSFSHKIYFLPPKPKSSFRHLKQGIQEVRRKHALVLKQYLCCLSVTQYKHFEAGAYITLVSVAGLWF